MRLSRHQDIAMIEQTETGTGFENGNSADPNDVARTDFEQLVQFLVRCEQVNRDPTQRGRSQTVHVVNLNKARRALVMRSAEVLAREIYQFNALEIKELSTRSDPTLLVKLAQAALTDTPVDRTERMALRGAERFRALLDKFGSSVTTRWVCEFLGSTESAVRKRVQRKTLLARRMPNGELSFPRFQFDETTGELVQGLQSFLVHVNSWPSEEVVRFLLVRHNPSVSNENPLELLKQGKLQQVLELADMHLTQRP
jgi:hypothetical protein